MSYKLWVVGETFTICIRTSERGKIYPYTFNDPEQTLLFKNINKNIYHSDPLLYVSHSFSYSVLLPIYVMITSEQFEVDGLRQIELNHKMYTTVSGH